MEKIASEHCPLNFTWGPATAPDGECRCLTEGFVAKYLRLLLKNFGRFLYGGQNRQRCIAASCLSCELVVSATDKTCGLRGPLSK